MATDFSKKAKQYGNNVLHTNYKYYVPVFSYNKSITELLGAIGDVEGKISSLKTKEKEFYQKFGKETYEDFMSFLREIMNSRDGDILRKLSNENLRSILLRKIAGGKQDLTDEEITISVNTNSEQLDKAQKALSSAFSAMSKIKTFSQNGGIVSLSTRIENSDEGDKKSFITAKMNVQVIKTIVNKFAKKNYNRSSYNSDAIATFLKNDKSFYDAFNITDSSGSIISSEQFSQMIKYRPYPWGYTNNEIKQGLKDDPVGTSEMLNKAKDDIKEEIDTLFGGASPELNEAKEEVLQTVLGDGYNIFFVGANWENGLLGAFGEFGTAVLLRYLYKKTGKNIDNFSAEIIGQQFGKQDIRIFDDFGIQVKNYATYRDEVKAFTRKEMEVRQHPSELGEYMDNSESFCGFLANYFFNVKINELYKNQFYDLETELKEDFTAELLRFAVKNIDDTITFYNIGGQYFIPASSILEFYVSQNELLDVKIEIERSVPIYSEEGGESRGNNEYWVRNSSSDTMGWSQTSENKNLFARLVNNDIKIISKMQELNLGYYGY